VLLSALLLAGANTNLLADVAIYTQSWDGSGFGQASQTDTSGKFGAYSAAYDNFSLGSSSSITSLAWTGISFNPSIMGTISAFTISFYFDSGGQPGAQLFSETIPGTANETFVNDSNSSGTYVENFSQALNTPFLATGGTQYWLSIVASSPFPPEWGWATGIGGDGVGFSTFSGSSGQVPYDFAFTLYGSATTVTGLPEPISVSLSAMGIAALALLRYRVFRQSSLSR
jgi:hypothetical protein